MNTRPKYHEIEPLVAQKQVDSDQRTVHCVFTCPVTARSVEASAYIRQGQGFADRLLDSTSRSFWYVASKVCSLVPEGFFRDVAEGAASRMAYSGGTDEVDTTQELNEAAIDAFVSVIHEFERGQQGWVAREVVSEFVTDFEKKLKEAPISTRYEIDVAAKALSYLASLDGVDSAERDFLSDFAPGFIEDTKPPSKVELSELNDSVKPTLFLLASALALADQEQSKGERSYLKKLSQDLDLSEEQVEELRRAAGQFIVEQCIALNSDPTDDEVARLARLTELSIDDVLRVMVRRRKRAL
jgi:hypothetical protein